MKNDYREQSILVLINENVNEKEVEEILFGIEEEEIPFSIKKYIIDDSKELAFVASNKSKLSVGIGIDSNRNIALTTDKLEKNNPLFIENLSSCDKVKRAIGSNGARLVKGIELKIY